MYARLAESTEYESLNIVIVWNYSAAVPDLQSALKEP